MLRLINTCLIAIAIFAAYKLGAHSAAPKIDTDAAIKLAYYLGQEDVVLEVLE